MITSVVDSVARNEPKPANSFNESAFTQRNSGAPEHSYVLCGHNPKAVKVRQCNYIHCVIYYTVTATGVQFAAVLWLM